jgi:hypothetical protein
MARQARRIHRELTPEARARLHDAQERIAAELPELIKRDRMRKAASEEATFSGELRRAIHKSDLTITQIASMCGLSLLELDEFLTGERTLDTEVVDRLVETLKLKLCHSNQS